MLLSECNCARAPPTKKTPLPGAPVFQVPFDPATEEIISFSGLEALKLSTPSTDTVFTYYYANSSEASGASFIQTPPVAGNWIYVPGARNNFTCGLVVDLTNSVFGFLQRKNGTLRHIPNPASSPFNPNILSRLQNPEQVPDFIEHLVKLGPECSSMVVNGELFRVNTTDFTFRSIPLPPRTEYFDGTGDFSHVILTGGLYRRTPGTDNFVRILALPMNLTQWRLKVSRQAIFLYGWTSFERNITGFMTNVTEFMAAILSDDGAVSKLIDSFADQYMGNYPPGFTSSPGLTKLGTGYRKVGQNVVTVQARSIDYTNGKALPVSFDNASHYFQLIGQNSSMGDIVFSDFFLYMHMGRNTPPVEAAYQFVSSLLAEMRENDIDSAEENWVCSWVDPMESKKMILYSAFGHNTSSSYVILKYDYGSLQSNTAPPPSETVPPPFLDFPLPAGATAATTYGVKNKLSWLFVVSSGSGSTDITIQDRNLTQSVTQAADVTLVTQNGDCKLFFDGTTYYTWRKSNSSFEYSKFSDASAIGGGSAVNPLIATNCERMRVNGQIYVLRPSTDSSLPTYVPTNNTAGFAPLLDSFDLSVGVLNNKIWFFDPFIKGYRPVMDEVFFSTVKLWTRPGRLVILSQQPNGLNSTNVDVSLSAYSIDANGIFTRFFNGSTVFANAAPSIWISPSCLNFVAYGNFFQSDLSVLKDVRGLQFNFVTKEATPVNMFEAKEFGDNTTTNQIQLTDSFFFARQKQSDVNITEYLVSMRNGDNKLISANPVSPASLAAYVRTVLQEELNTFTVSVESVEAGHVIVRQRVINLALPPPTEGTDGSLVVAGKVLPCPVGCQACSGTSLCLKCNNGFSLITNSCTPCARACKTCDSTGACLSCQDGTYLMASTARCANCPAECFQCKEVSGQPKCQSCPPGSTFNANKTCGRCSLKNCQECDPNSAQACLVCANGFFVSTTNNKCVQCASSCSSCSPANITQCTACAANLELSNGACIRCPRNCLTCQRGVCANCLPSFTASNGVCVKNCMPPCLTCLADVPTTCLSCFGSSLLQGGRCVQDPTCSADSSCKSCNMGNILVLGQCLPCNLPDANCLQCSPDNAELCTLCKGGFYLDPSTVSCASCQSNCRICTGDLTCVSCMDGFTLLGAATASVCYPCVQPCATCLSDPKICSTCIDGFTLKGWKCASNSNVGFVFTLQTSAAFVLAKTSDIVDKLLLLLNQTDPNIITLDGIKDGSAILSGAISSPNPSGTSLVLGAALGAGASLGGFPVLSSVLVASDAVDPPRDNNALAIGLGVGLPLAAICIGLIAFLIYKKTRAATTNIVPSTE